MAAGELRQGQAGPDLFSGRCRPRDWVGWLCLLVSR